MTFQFVRFLLPSAEISSNVFHFTIDGLEFYLVFDFIIRYFYCLNHLFISYYLGFLFLLTISIFVVHVKLIKFSFANFCTDLVFCFVAHEE